MESKVKKFIVLTIVWIGAVSLTLYWYDWKLLIILMLFGWGMNLENKKS